ncbi:MAG: adenine-specific methyltransferase EcoRI family protein [Bacteroidaceae bacterium]|nr:adenine-specific methyltransferase EcoRI family protein [Bacteroidaceae bacterium]MBQ9171121.1 adenine-specific methyltransferase EcoRI family protein [Bacteroidaceae bacterium]
MANKNLNAAKTAKKDEFYTQMKDIERELQHYWPHFRGKVVLCNCDDPYESNFFKYFALNFNQLGLKKLICTCFDGSPVLGNELLLDFGDFTDEPKKMAYKVEITEVRDLNGDGAVDLADVQYLLRNDKNAISLLRQHGDFRSAECIELLKQADIVVTNPPFSLFREYIGQLMEYEKKFLIVGNQGAIIYKEIFPSVINNKIWLGYGFKGGAAHFVSPYEDTATASDHKEGMIRVSGVHWFTNLDIAKRNDPVDLVRRYSAEEYPKYDNYDAIEVSKTSDIPCDYAGAMGVPITFLDKYNPDQFEIIGATENEATEEVRELRIQGFTKYDRPYIKGIRKYARILIRNKHPQTT